MSAKTVAVERLQDFAPEGETVVRGTVLYGRPYYWTVNSKGIYHLRSWPVEVTLDV